MDDQNQEPHHVRFQEAQDEFSHESEIVVKQAKPGKAMVHLGFLSINHKYRIKFLLSNTIISVSELEYVNKNTPSLGLKILQLHQVESGIEIELEMLAYKEKLLKESVHFHKTDGSTVEDFEVVLHARVLGKGKGTPSLRQGIHLIHVVEDEESEQSDWQGFD